MLRKTADIYFQVTIFLEGWIFITDLINNLAMIVQPLTFHISKKKDTLETDYMKIFFGSVTDNNNRFYNILVATGIFDVIYKQKYSVSKSL